jgi:hypothetical protein
MAATYFRTYAMAEAGSEKLTGPPPGLVQFADAVQGIDPILTGSIKAGFGPR